MYEQQPHQALETSIEEAQVRAIARHAIKNQSPEKDTDTYIEPDDHIILSNN